MSREDQVQRPECIQFQVDTVKQTVHGGHWQSFHLAYEIQVDQCVRIEMQQGQNERLHKWARLGAIALNGESGQWVTVVHQGQAWPLLGVL